MFKNLQGLSLLHLLWKSTFSARCFWSLGISRHCILTLHRLPKQHKFTFSWLPFETNSLKSSPLVHSLFYIFPITFSAVSSYLSSCYSLPLQKLHQSKFWQQPNDTRQLDILWINKIIYLLTFILSDRTPCKVTLLLVGYCLSVCIIFSY